MEKLFIPYRQALELKELGFDEKCLMAFYGSSREDKKDELFLHNGFGRIRNSNLINEPGVIVAPLWQQAFDWFRTEHGLVGNVEYLLNRWFCYTINDGKDEKTSRRLFTEFETHEEAQLELLKRLIKSKRT